MTEFTKEQTDWLADRLREFWWEPPAMNDLKITYQLWEAQTEFLARRLLVDSNDFVQEEFLRRTCGKLYKREGQDGEDDGGGTGEVP